METPNLSYIKKLSKGDVSFEKDILAIVKEELQEEIENYNKSFSKKDFKKAKIFVHRIKHKMSILGLEKSYEITNNFENDIRVLDFKHQAYFESMLPIMMHFVKNILNPKL